MYCCLPLFSVSPPSIHPSPSLRKKPIYFLCFILPWILTLLYIFLKLILSLTVLLYLRFLKLCVLIPILFSSVLPYLGLSYFSMFSYCSSFLLSFIFFLYFSSLYHQLYMYLYLREFLLFLPLPCIFFSVIL